jgi:hypothetical protein
MGAFAASVVGPAMLARACRPHMRARGGGVTRFEDLAEGHRLQRTGRVVGKTAVTVKGEAAKGEAAPSYGS